MTLGAQIRAIDNLNKVEKRWFDLICINQGDKTPRLIAESLIQKRLVRKVPGGYDVASYFVHMAWCKHCSNGEE